MENQPLRELKSGDKISGVYLVESSNLKQARNGKFFIQMVLRDNSASIKAMKWEAKKEDFRLLEQRPFLSLQGRIEEFQSKPQVIVDQFQPMNAEEAGIDPARFLPQSSYAIDDMLAQLNQLLESLTNVGIQKLIGNILKRPAVEKGLRVAPAGKSMHHAYAGGLLEHILSLAGLAEKILSHYPILDRDVLLAGVILHDLGKVEELSYESRFAYTDRGQLLGHIVMVLSWVQEESRSIPELSPDCLTEIQHLITSHHGKLEFGSPKTPMTAEAIALHFIDNLDAKLAAIDSLYRDSELSESNRWSDMSYMFNSKIFFPERMATPEELDSKRHESPLAFTREGNKSIQKPTSKESQSKGSDFDHPDQGELPF